MVPNAGDFAPGVTIRYPWNTFAAAGASASPTVNGTLKIYKDGGLTESTAGATISIAYDAIAGRHMAIIDTSADGSFYAAGSQYFAAIDAETVDSQVLNFWAFSFTINNQVALTANGCLAAATYFNNGAAVSSAVVGNNDVAISTRGTYSGGNITGDITGNLSGSVGSVTGAVGSVTGFTPANIITILNKTNLIPASPAAVGSAMTLTGAYDFAKGTVAMTESYAAKGAAMTPAQSLHMMVQAIIEFAQSSTTGTVKKRDGSTSAFTVTFDAATNPTSVTQAT